MNRLSFTVENYRASVAGDKTQTRRCHPKARYAVGEIVALTLPHWRGHNAVGSVWDEVLRETRWQHERTGQTCYLSLGAYTPSEDHSRWRLCPAFLMPVWSCLHFAEILGTRAERVQDITHVDCVAEGIYACPGGWRYPGRPSMLPFSSARDAYACEWYTLNAERPGCAWADNPWVLVYDYRLCEKPEAT